MPNIQSRIAIFTNMQKSQYKVIGVMSGTSLDGIDMALINFTKSTSWDFEIVTAQTVSYPREIKNNLSAAISYNEQDLSQLDRAYTAFLAGKIQQFMTENSIGEVDFICSHGHTIKHEPQHGITLQIGNLPSIAKILNRKVVCNFRVQDVKLGGQGAPLVPVGDELLFSNYDYCLNLGGFANISTKMNNQRIAYDICAVNTVLNFYSERLGKEYDENGDMARIGKSIPDLFEKLQSLSFYKKEPPKSLGVEFLNSVIFPIIKVYENKPLDILRTYTEHIALQISANLQGNSSSEVIVTGGGAFNNFLIDRIKSLTSAKLIIPSEAIINYKEALIFALLGVLKMRGEVNVFSSVTGAVRDHSSGVIFKP